MSLGELAGLEPAEELRRYFGDALAEACRRDPRVVVLDGDVGNSTMTHTVRAEFPERFYNFGVAEKNLVGIGAGLAACGYVPFVTSFPSFLLCNAFDQIRVTVAIASLNVKFVGSHGGLSATREGPAPMSIEDYGLTQVLPGFITLVPSDPVIMKRAVLAAAEKTGPVYIRSSREPLPRIYGTDAPFQIGKANCVRAGHDVAIVACGMMVAIALDAAKLLENDGLYARVLDMHTVKPLDRSAIVDAARETGAMVTVEEHLVLGGMGSAVAQVVAEACPIPMRFLGLRDRYARSGSYEELLTALGLTASDVAAAARDAVAAKSERR